MYPRIKNFLAPLTLPHAVFFLEHVLLPAVDCASLLGGIILWVGCRWNYADHLGAVSRGAILTDQCDCDTKLTSTAEIGKEKNLRAPRREHHHCRH